MKSLAALAAILACASLSWSPGAVFAQASCNLPLPCGNSIDTDETAFSITNTGSGRAGLFTISDLLNNRPSLEGRTNSTADGAAGVLGRVFGTDPGDQSAGVRGINNEMGGDLSNVRIGVWGQANAGSGLGVLGTSREGVGVSGTSETGRGVTGVTENGVGMFGETTAPTGGIGVWGRSNSRAVIGTQGSTSCAGTYAVGACATTGDGVSARADNGIGVLGRSTTRGVIGTQGLANSCAGTFAVGACATTGDGLVARGGTSGSGVVASAASGTPGNGVTATADTGRAVFGNSASGIGVIGNSTTRGVIGTLGLTSCSGTYAVGGCGAGLGDGVVGKSSGAFRAGYFEGNVVITGSLTKGSGTFKIDHPKDPKNKYLSHSFVESTDMLTIYTGNVVLDAQGVAKVVMPDWFESLNREFRYQLTAIGAPGPSLYIAEEIAQHSFKIAGGQPGMKVSWQVTGIRHDPYAQQNRTPVEEWKTAAEQGKYLHPAAYGLPEEMGVSYVQAPPQTPAGQLTQSEPQAVDGRVARERSR